VLLDRSDQAEGTNRSVEELAYEPILLRPIVAGAQHPEALIFGLAARAYLAQHGLGDDALAELVAAQSALGAAGSRSKEDILASPVIAGPLHELHLPPRADVAAALVLTTRDRGRRRATIRGVGCGAVDAMPGRRDLAQQEATAHAAKRAYSAAGLSEPVRADRVEVYNPYAIDGVLAVEALGLAAPGKGLESLLGDGAGRVNPTGGVQGAGWARGTSSLVQAATAIEELSADGAGATLLCQSWGGFAGSTAAVAVLEVGKGGS
jgi:acetyl-CoA acetyltransferase